MTDRGDRIRDAAEAALRVLPLAVYTSSGGDLSSQANSTRWTNRLKYHAAMLIFRLVPPAVRLLNTGSTSSTTGSTGEEVADGDD